MRQVSSRACTGGNTASHLRQWAQTTWQSSQIFLDVFAPMRSAYYIAVHLYVRLPFCTHEITRKRQNGFS